MLSKKAKCVLHACRNISNIPQMPTAICYAAVIFSGIVETFVEGMCRDGRKHTSRARCTAGKNSAVHGAE